MAVAFAVTAAPAALAAAFAVTAAPMALTVAFAVTAASTALAMAFAMTLAVMVTVGLGVILQSAGGQGSGGLVGRAGDAGAELHARLGQRHPGASADAAADHRVGLCAFQEGCQSPVAGAAGVDDHAVYDPAVLRVIYLELRRTAEMLENFSVFISYCDSHSVNTFLFDSNSHIVSGLQPVAAAGDPQPQSVHDRPGQLLSGAVVNGGYGGTAHVHALGALFLGQPLPIHEPDGLKFVQGQDHRLSRELLPIVRGKAPVIRIPLDTAFAGRSGHGFHLRF